MGYPFTKTGFNMFDMMSMMQKSIRRADYNNAGFAARQLKDEYRATLWNRMVIASAEDCFGIITKEVVHLMEEDKKITDDHNIARALAVMCKSKKSRDACYFACNFVLVSRETEVPDISFAAKKLCEEIKKRKPKKSQDKYDQFGFFQEDMFSADAADEENDFKTDHKKYLYGANLIRAIRHLDMDAIGFCIDKLRKEYREFLWEVFEYFSGIMESKKETVLKEIQALKRADDLVNGRKKEKDEIFISKAAIILCYYIDSNFESVASSDIVNGSILINWNKAKVKPISECILENNEIPEWVYDCHTLKGKKMGKTDWDMTISEQKALTPLQPAYFDEASWLYTFQDDFKNDRISKGLFDEIVEYAKIHKANPVEMIPY